MIYIKADFLQDGLYQIQDGQIHKYKAKGGTVQTYEMGEIVRCKDCKWFNDRITCPLNTREKTEGRGFCNRGKRREDDEE